MFESYRNRDFGFAKVPDDDWVHHRLQISALWEKDEHIRVFSELTWGEMQGMEADMAPPDEDQVDLLQLYVHARPRLEDSNWTIRVGRQILFYGSGRLLAHREGANQRLVHDALRLGWQHEQWRVDALVASPVRIGPEEFDNASRSHQSLLWGVYATGSTLGKEHGMDLY